MNNTAPEPDNTWYKNFYVWLIIVLPLCAVAASFATLFIAASNPPEMAIADYSDIEAIARRQAQRDQEAAQLGLQAELLFDHPETNAESTSSAVELNLSADIDRAWPATLTLKIVHSTLSSRDAETELHGSGGTYRGVIALPEGAYDLLLEPADQSWRLATRVNDRPAELTFVPVAAPPTGS